MSSKEQKEYMKYLKDEDRLLYDAHFVNNGRKKCNNGKNEKEDIKNIMEYMTTPTCLGGELIVSLEELVGKKFKHIEERSESNLKSHYDFKITYTDGTCHMVEHKGSAKYKKIKDHKPWADSVQFANVPGNKSPFSMVYCRIWYDMYIFSGYLSKEYKLKEKIPTFNTWYKQDCCNQKPGTLFGRELKRNFRNEHGSNSKLLRDLRGKVNKQFVEYVNNNPDELEKFKITMIEIGKDMLNQKDIWLKVNGNLNDNRIYFKWYNKFQLGDEYDIKVSTKSDIDFQFTSLDKQYIDFQCKLRWRNGCGFSNVSFGLS